MTTDPEQGPKAADVVSKTRGGLTTHYLIGPQRATREEAEQDLCNWRNLERRPPQQEAERAADIERHYAESLIAAVDDWLIANDDRGLRGDWREALRWVIERDGLPV